MRLSLNQAQRLDVSSKCFLIRGRCNRHLLHFDAKSIQRLIFTMTEVTPIEPPHKRRI